MGSGFSKPNRKNQQTFQMYKIRQCSKCPGDTEYFCEMCRCELCLQCKEMHLDDFDTNTHDVAIYRNQFKYNTKQENCAIHPDTTCIKYCTICELPICHRHRCMDHRNHTSLMAYNRDQSKLQKYRQSKTINSIRSEALFYRHALLVKIKAKIRTCHAEILHRESDILKKAQTLKNRLDRIIHHLYFGHSCTKQYGEVKKQIANIKSYICLFERSASKPVKFLVHVKRPSLPKILEISHHSQVCVSTLLNTANLIKLFDKIKIYKEKWDSEANEMLQYNIPPIELDFFTAEDVPSSVHICFKTSNTCWLSYKDKAILTNTAGETLQSIRYLNGYCLSGSITVDRDKSLIYIGETGIFKLYANSSISTLLITDLMKKTCMSPQCVYSSQSTGDLLVGMVNGVNSNVRRYKNSMQLRQIIQYNYKGEEIYRNPLYITENKNGDVVVSDDWKAVVVTDRRGNYRFSFKKHPCGSVIRPRGVCTDALSNILVCDEENHSILILNKDGRFISDLLIKPRGIFRPWSLSYDVKTQKLWVGSFAINKVCVYRYLTRMHCFTDENSPNEANVTDNETQPEENECSLNLSISPELKGQIQLDDKYNIEKISSVTPDRVWIKKDRKLILKSMNGYCCYCLDLSDEFGDIVFTVNKENELIYLVRNYNIRKLSNDTNTNKLFITNIWYVRCMYSSPRNGSLLVGKSSDDEGSRHAKVQRYSNEGKLILTIKQGKIGQHLYESPSFITENSNGDVVVSDGYRSIVVTTSGGTYRFSYTGHPKGSVFAPHGICTDSLLHILVCDSRKNTIHIINKDGKFLSFLPMKSEDVNMPKSLSYDVNKHRLWVGCGGNNKVCVYDYMTRKEVLPGSADNITASSNIGPSRRSSIAALNYGTTTKEK